VEVSAYPSLDRLRVRVGCELFLAAGAIYHKSDPIFLIAEVFVVSAGSRVSRVSVGGLCVHFGDRAVQLPVIVWEGCAVIPGLRLCEHPDRVVETVNSDHDVSQQQLVDLRVRLCFVVWQW
jgi:hypothetical protein